MTKFRGYFEHTVNDAGRVSFPHKFRQILDVVYSRKLVLLGLPNRVEIYPEEVFRKVEEENQSLPLDDPRVFEYVAYLNSRVWEAEYDGQGRLLLPSKLKAEQGVEKDVIFVGLTDRILMFTPAQWESFRKGAQDRFETNAAYVASLKRGAKPAEGDAR
jgi:MraZ protein